MAAKDLFSTQSKGYAQYRPDYPPELFNWILEHTSDTKQVWDCATGNGQAAVSLSKFFDQVQATDLSQNQLLHAQKRDNIHYQQSRAEKSPFEDKQFDLVTVAQALHWFDFEPFYAEVCRVLKPKGTFAAWGYGLLEVDEQVDEHIRELYSLLTEYWAPERNYIENNYANIPFPFTTVASKRFYSRYTWELSTLEGYLNTWSAVQTYLQQHDENPVKKTIKKMRQSSWPQHIKKTVCFPIFLRLGILN